MKEWSWAILLKREYVSEIRRVVIYGCPIDWMGTDYSPPMIGSQYAQIKRTAIESSLILELVD